MGTSTLTPYHHLGARYWELCDQELLSRGWGDVSLIPESMVAYTFNPSAQKEEAGKSL